MDKIKQKTKTVSFITCDPEHKEMYWGNRCLVFEVPYDWAVDYCGGENKFDTFYWEYTSDETMDMYCIALLDGVVVSERIEENIWRD